jgi:hypothetical protein
MGRTSRHTSIAAPKGVKQAALLLAMHYRAVLRVLRKELLCSQHSFSCGICLSGSACGAAAHSMTRVANVSTADVGMFAWGGPQGTHPLQHQKESSKQRCCLQCTTGLSYECCARSCCVLNTLSLK